MIAELTDAQERYIETILVIGAEKRVARVKEIAAALSIRAASVTAALQQLAAKGFVEYEPYGTACLTARGQQAGRELLLRHRAVQDFLENILGVATLPAGDIATHIEHVLSSEVLCRLVQFNEHYKKRARPPFVWRDNCAKLCRKRYSIGCTRLSKQVQ